MSTINQNNNYYLLCGYRPASTKTSVAAENENATKAAVETDSVSTQTTKTAEEKARDEKVKEMRAYWKAPLTDEQREELRSRNTTLDIQVTLDIKAERPEYQEQHRDFIHNLGYGLIYVPGYAAKKAEMSLLSKGEPLDYKIQTEYEKIARALDSHATNIEGYERMEAQEKEIMASGMEARHKDSILATHQGFMEGFKGFIEDGIEYIQFSLGDLAYLHTTVPGSLEYAREAIYQRSTIERGEGIDVGQLMHQHGLITDEEFAALPRLSMPANSEKLQAYTAKVEAAKAEAAAAEAAVKQAAASTETIANPTDEVDPGEYSNIATGNHTQPDSRYVLKSAAESYAKLDRSALMNEIWVDASGKVNVPDEYLLDELLA